MVLGDSVRAVPRVFAERPGFGLLSVESGRPLTLIEPKAKLLSYSLLVATLLYISPWPLHFLVAWTKNNSIKNQK